MKEFNELIGNPSKLGKETAIPQAPDRSSARRLMKAELKMMEKKLGERGMGERLCKEYKLPCTLKYKYAIMARVMTVMLERNEQHIFEEASNETAQPFNDQEMQPVQTLSKADEVQSLEPAGIDNRGLQYNPSAVSFEG